jgi:succinyl-diaminopimelate desuccinylase
MKTSDWGTFAEKFRLAVESSLETHFERGLSGLELEFNVLDRELRPVTAVGYGPERRSFADHLMDRYLPEAVRPRFQLEVFHWMIEGATRPYYSARGTALEGRLLEAAAWNALARAGLAFGERFFALHGNVPFPVDVNGDAIPDGWSLAKKKYLSRCVALFGPRLATAGIHTNHSYPESLLSWDFFHLPRHRREGRTLIDFRNDALIRATRLLRPFCPLFIAASASTPFAWETVDGSPAVVLTDRDSNRLLTFPNPPELDVAYLYASHADYLRISYDLVRRGVRFGANNWTPVRARSDVDPVNRNIWATSEQLQRLYQKGLYRAGERANFDEAERALLVENLCARVDLPMTRVEVRTDEGGDDFALSLAKIVLKELLLLRIYADESFGAAFVYDADDVQRARRNEEAAARDGLGARIEDPFTGAPASLREFLAATLADLEPLARALEWREALSPLAEMAAGGANPAGRTREWFRSRLGSARRGPSGDPVVPREAFTEWLEERGRLLEEELREASEAARSLGDEEGKIRPLLVSAAQESSADPAVTVRVGSPRPQVLAVPEDAAGEAVGLAAELVRIPSVTNCPRERLKEVWRCARFIASHLKDAGAEVRLFEGGKYPAVLAGFPGRLLAPVLLGGHFDVVEPDPDDLQFEPRVEGDYLWGRGSADMKTVVASDLVWMRRRIRRGPPYPPIGLLFVGNEENGEAEPCGTPHVLEELRQTRGWSPGLMVLGERTGEKGDERFGEICTSNRGVVRLRVTARGERAHTGMAGAPADLSERLIEARAAIAGLLGGRFTLQAEDGWVTGVRFPFLSFGEAGVYNVTPAEAVLGLEVRPIPEDDVEGFLEALRRLCGAAGLEVEAEVLEAGVTCPPENPYLGSLLRAARSVQGAPPRIGRKLAGTSARFAPEGAAVVWGQTGIGPHTRHERHFIPSIGPYLETLDAFSEDLAGSGPSNGTGRREIP